MPFKKGSSGNPGGKSNTEKEFKLAAQKHWKRALAILVEGMDSTDARTRIAAAKELLDRGFGKAAQSVEVASSAGQPFMVVIGEKKLE